MPRRLEGGCTATSRSSNEGAGGNRGRATDHEVLPTAHIRAADKGIGHAAQKPRVIIDTRKMSIQYASQRSIRRVRVPIGGMAHPLVPGAVEFELLDRGSTVPRSPPSNLTMGMRRAHLHLMSHCEIEVEQASCVMSYCAGQGLSRYRVLNGERGWPFINRSSGQRHGPSRLDSRPAKGPRTG